MATYGWDAETQRIGRIPGLGIIENGYFDFSSGTEAIDVATHMQKVVMGFGIARTQGPPDFQGLVATTACLGGHIPKLLMNNQYDAAVERALWFRDLFGPERFFLEVQPDDQDEQKKLNENRLRTY